MRKRAMTSEQASQVKRQGHLDARIFAEALGIGKEFSSEPQAKKDVIDKNGYSYSVKSGQKKWQIFLYGESRFKNDYIFQAMNGLGDIFLSCIESFPRSRSEYLENKEKYKIELSRHMVKLCDKLRNKKLLRSFLDKSIFNSGEVDFLAIKQGDIFHIFLNRDVVEVLSSNIEVENSRARGKNQYDNQKVVFKVNNKTLGEIEMRNDSELHYREIKFWLFKNQTLALLVNNIKRSEELNKNVIIFGRAIKKLIKNK